MAPDTAQEQSPTIRERMRAYLLGMREFRIDFTTHFDGDLIETYDRGRDQAHRLTLRLFDPYYRFGKRERD